MQTIINGIKIEAVSAYLPENVLEMTELSALYGENEVANIMQTTGIERIRYASQEVTAADMCYEAALHLLQQENLQPSEIDGLVFVSQTPDYILPSTSVVLQHKLGMSKETVCLDIHYGCSGYIYGLFQASLWIQSNACKRVLVLAGDTSTKMINERDRSVKMVFGDGGTATLVAQGDHSIGFSIQSDGSGYDQLIIPAGGFRMPISEATKELVFDADNNGRTPEDLYMDGFAIFRFVAVAVHTSINKLIDQMSWQKDDVGLFALHQANTFMVEHVRKKLKVDTTLVPVNVKNYGNTGPATIPLLLCDACTRNTYNLEKVVMSGFGVGLSLGNAAVNLTTTKFHKPING